MSVYNFFLISKLFSLYKEKETPSILELFKSDLTRKLDPKPKVNQLENVFFFRFSESAISEPIVFVY